MSLSNERGIHSPRTRSPSGSTHGFTLVEITVMTVAIAILAAIALPNIARAKQTIGIQRSSLSERIG